jgi:hypothetical protein
MNGREKPSAVQFPVVSDGPSGTVRLSPDAHAEYQRLFQRNDKLSKQQRTHLKRYFERFCQLGPQSLGPEKFKLEDRFADGKGGNVAVYAFKPFKFRVYGGVLAVGGKNTFVGTRTDEKKQDDADRETLKATASDIADLIEYKGK